MTTRRQRWEYVFEQHIAGPATPPIIVGAMTEEQRSRKEACAQCQTMTVITALVFRRRGEKVCRPCKKASA